MSNPVRTLACLLGCSLLIVACVLGLYRHERNSAKRAKQEAAELNSRLENIANELAAIQEQVVQLRDEHVAAKSTADYPPTINQTARNETTQSSSGSSVQNVSAVPQVVISPERVLRGQQQAIAELRIKTSAQDEKVKIAKAKLTDWQRSLNISDEIAVLDSSAALKAPELVNYWAYFEAKRELEEALDFNRVLKRKVQIEELDMAIETARHNGAAK